MSTTHSKKQNPLLDTHVFHNNVIQLAMKKICDIMSKS